jgi:hypothetical protein
MLIVTFEAWICDARWTFSCNFQSEVCNRIVTDEDPGCSNSNGDQRNQPPKNTSESLVPFTPL